MEAKVKIVVTNLKEFHELYQELREKEKTLKEVLEKIEICVFLNHRRIDTCNDARNCINGF